MKSRKVMDSVLKLREVFKSLGIEVVDTKFFVDGLEIRVADLDEKKGYTITVVPTAVAAKITPEAIISKK